MFSLLESKKEITKAQQKLEATIRRDFTNKAVKNIGYPGGTKFNAKVDTDHHYWFWSEDQNRANKPHPRQMNWFGLFRGDVGLQISVEINTPYEGRNDQIAGFFGRDNDTGAIYLLHSGRLGGGKRGVGKDAFLTWSNEQLIEVVDSSGGIRSGFLVMPIEGKAATRSAIRYIDTVDRFKQAVRAGETHTRQFQRKQKEYRDFYSEPRGRRKGKRSGEIDYLSRHGDILDALKAWRNSQPLKKGARLVKDVFLDMGVEMDRELVEVYEIKTSTARSHVYSAIGQLMVRGTAEECRKVIVLPHKEPIATDLTAALQRLEIEILKFRLSAVKAVIV